MLTSLFIENVILIDKLTLQFDNGLCVLTGETGAGKSILLDALGLALGQRANGALVRPGADKAVVTAVFDLPDHHPVHHVLAEQGLESDAELILRRTVSAEGKSKAFLNDAPISVSLLKTLSKELIEIHGQFDQILQPSVHRDLLDQYGGHHDDRHRVAQYFDAYRLLQVQKNDLLKRLENQDNHKVFLEKSVQELEELDPQEAEEEALLEKRNRLQNQEKVMSGLMTASHILTSEKGMLDLMGSALTAVEKSAKYIGEPLDPILATLNQAHTNLMDADALLVSFQDDQEHCEETLESVEDRLYALRALARKHNCLVAELPARFAHMLEELKALVTGAETLEDLDRQLKGARDAYVKEATLLSQKRTESAKQLAQDVERELKPLKLEKARFKAEPTHLDEDAWTRAGIDHVAFQVQTNPGLPFGEIASVASGGERSRLMLALKVILAHKSQASILIFDEIDSGVGGAVATAIGERMARLGQTQQVLAITHSPQVAAAATHHFYVEKSQVQDMTTTAVTLLPPEKSLEEIARMLSGDHVTSEARAAAQNLIGSLEVA